VAGLIGSGRVYLFGFAVLATRRVAQRVLAHLAAKSAAAVGSKPMRCSLGLATLPPHGFETPPGAPPEGSISFPALATRLIALADEAMYRAKRSGGNRAEKAEDLAWTAPVNALAEGDSPSRLRTED
jgi:GGDEF domain-containing protein